MRLINMKKDINEIKDLDAGTPGTYKKIQEFDKVAEEKESNSEIQNDEKEWGVSQLITNTLKCRSKKVKINSEQQPNTHSKSIDLGADNVVKDPYSIYFLQTNSVSENSKAIVDTTFNANIQNTTQILVTFKTNKINKTHESFQDDGYVTMAEIQEERKKFLQSKTSSEQSDYMNMNGCKTHKRQYANWTFFSNNTSEKIVTDDEIIVRDETVSLSSKL